MVGTRSILMEGSMMEPYSVLAPGSVLPPARRIPEGEMWGGSPARFIKKLSGDEVSLRELITCFFKPCLGCLNNSYYGFIKKLSGDEVRQQACQKGWGWDEVLVSRQACCFGGFAPAVRLRSPARFIKEAQRRWGEPAV